MKFSALALAALLPAAVLAEDASAASAASATNHPDFPVLEVRDNHPDFPVLEVRDIEKRDVSGRVLVDGLRYRTCPRTSCTAVGQYAAGTAINIKCYTRSGTTVVNGDAGWAKLSNGYWVAMAYGKYITWYSTLYAC